MLLHSNNTLLIVTDFESEHRQVLYDGGCDADGSALQR